MTESWLPYWLLFWPKFVVIRFLKITNKKVVIHSKIPYERNYSPGRSFSLFSSPDQETNLHLYALRKIFHIIIQHLGTFNPVQI